MGRKEKEHARKAAKARSEAVDEIKDWWRKALAAEKQLHQANGANCRDSTHGSRHSTNGVGNVEGVGFTANSSARRPGCLVELHCHSTCSDGALTPARLVARAASKQVRLSISEE